MSHPMIQIEWRADNTASRSTRKYSAASTRSRALRACVFGQNVWRSSILSRLALRSFIGRPQTTKPTRVERLAADRVPSLPWDLGLPDEENTSCNSQKGRG